MKGFEDVKDVEHGVENPNELKWNYPSIGYNASQGILYLGDDTPKEFTCQILNIRQCKEVNVGTKTEPRWRRYHPYAKKENMVSGVDVQQRLQAIVTIDEELHVFGAKSWTARGLFANAQNGRWMDENLMPGLWKHLLDTCDNVKKQYGKSIAPSSISVTIKVGKKFKNEKSGGDLYRLEWSDIEYAGEETMLANDQLFKDEDLAGWAKEWHTANGGEALDEIATPVIEEDDPADVIPGFDL